MKYFWSSVTVLSLLNLILGVTDGLSLVCLVFIIICRSENININNLI